MTETICAICKKAPADRGSEYCYRCTHCAGCTSRTDQLKDGLCIDCRTILRQNALKIYSDSVSDVQVVNRAQNGLTISVRFSTDVEGKIRALQRENIGAMESNKKQAPPDNEDSDNKGRSFFGFGRKKKEVEEYKKPSDNKGKEPRLIEPFYILSAVLESKKIQSNSVKIKLEYTYGRTFTRMISGGNYDFMGGVEEGYLAHITVDFDDGCLLPIVTKAMREELKFACQVSNLSVDGYLKDKAPSEQGQAILIDKIAAIIPARIKDGIASNHA